MCGATFSNPIPSTTQAGIADTHTNTLKTKQKKKHHSVVFKNVNIGTQTNIRRVMNHFPDILKCWHKLRIYTPIESHMTLKGGGISSCNQQDVFILATVSLLII